MLSACYFVAMIVARKTLSEDDLYFWNALVTLVAMSFTFCFFGTEQLFLRFSQVSQDGIVTTNRSTLRLMAAMLVVFTVLLGALSETYFFQLGSLLIYPYLAFCVGLFVLVYNLLRVRKSFILAQLAANGWKFTILLGVFLAHLGDAPWIIMSGLGTACAGVLWLLICNRSALHITNKPMPTNWLPLFSGFFLSLFVLMLLNSADRLIVTRYGSEALFSEYVYLVTLLLLPFSLLSNYFGFKEMAYLKDTYCRRLLVRKTLLVGILAAALFVPWFGLIYLLQSFLDVPVEPTYFLPCIVIVACRNSYAIVSTLFGLQGKPTQLHAANLITLCMIITVIIMLTHQQIRISVLLYFVSFFWLFRLAIFVYFTRSIENYTLKAH